MTLWLWDALLRLTVFLKCQILGDKKAPCLPIMTISPEPTTLTETTLDMGNADLEQDLDDVSDKAIPFKMSVLVANDTKQGSREMLPEKDDDHMKEEEVPWYAEHKETLVLSAVAGLAALSLVLLRSRHK